MEKRCEWLIEGKLHRHRIDCRDSVSIDDTGEHPGDPVVDRQQALEGIDHGIRRNRRAILEFGVRIEREGVGQPILAYGVAGGEPGHQLHRIAEMAVERIVEPLLGNRDRAIVTDCRIDIWNVD